MAYVRLFFACTMLAGCYGVVTRSDAGIEDPGDPAGDVGDPDEAGDPNGSGDPNGTGDGDGHDDDPGDPGPPISEWPVGTADGPFDWVGVIGTGQSLHVGCDGAAISTTSPYNNVMLRDDGPDPKYPVNGATTAQWSMVPLVEPVRLHVPGYAADDSRYPNNICISNGRYGESPTSGFANTMSALWEERGKGDYVTAHTVVARGATCLFQLIKADVEQRAFAAGISEARVFKAFADQAGKTYGVAAVLLTHGECDTQLETQNYRELLYQMWSDYNTDVKLVTGQTRDVVLLASQQSGIPSDDNAPNVQLWRAGNEHPGKIVCVGPKYAYGDYGVHFQTGSAYERLGEKYAEVFDYVVNRGAPWKPLGPNNITRAGAVLRISMDVPHPPMVWDSHLAPPHATAHTAWANGKGFEVTDEAGTELTIQSAEIDGNDIVLTLASVPVGPLKVAYALTQDADGWLGGMNVGLHGLLRDTNDFVGYAKEDLEVNVVNGSRDITIGADGFLRRAALDIVTGPGVPDDTVVSFVLPTKITLSTPWTGATGVTTMSFHHNHYNYAVHFSMDVP